MAKKVSSNKQEAATKLLEINGQLHEIMANIEVDKKVEEGIAYIPQSHISNAWDLGQSAISAAHNAGYSGALLDDTEKLQGVIPKVLDTYKATDDKLAMPAEVAGDLTALILNYLANKIHDIAMNLIGATGQIQACSKSELDPEEAAAVSKYCSGVLPELSQATVTTVALKNKMFDGKKFVQHYPTNIVHKLGLHKTEVSTFSAGKVPKVAIEYHESGPQYHDSKNRMQGVSERLTKEGLVCHSEYPNLYCSGDISKDKLTQLASFFSLLSDADVSGMDEDTIPVVSDAVWDYAGDLVSKNGDKTWESGQGHLSWSQMHSKWQKDKELYQKAVIYGDLKQLAIYRDRHHELEEALGLGSTSKPGKEAAKELLTNAKNALTLCKKNKWETGNLSGLISSFESSPDWGTSDGLGNKIHQILYGQLQKLGKYGSCGIDEGIPDVNAGILSYCEGALNGTSSAIEHGGSMVMHGVPPNKFTSFIIDENPKGGYDVHIPVKSGFWDKELAGYLQDKFGFDCTNSSYGKWQKGQVCNAHIDSHDKIRLLAIFLSNLKGGGELVSTECAPHVLHEAWEHSQKQAEKGTMAFTQEPFIQNTKQWIDKCYKDYGIMPPGMTKEQQEILKAIGSDKIYAGCDLSADESIPNGGVLSYCEGVRINPQSDINAIANPQGFLRQFFHGTTDEIVNVYVNSVGDGQYLVELKNMNLYSPELTQEVIKTLKEENFTCSGNQCKKEIGESDIRRLAMFLSSLHHAYKLDASKIPDAVQLAIAQITKISNDKNAYKNKVSIFTQEEWEQALKKGKPTVTKHEVTEIKPETPAYQAIDASYIKSLPSSGSKPGWKLGGCYSSVLTSPTQIKKGYCAGVIDKALDDTGKQFSIEGTAYLTSKENTHHIQNCGDVIFDSHLNELYITIPDELAKVDSIKETLESSFLFESGTPNVFHKKTTSLGAARVAYFISHLHHITDVSEAFQEQAVKLAADKALAPTITTEPIYPFMPSSWKKALGPYEGILSIYKVKKPFSKLLSSEIQGVNDYVKKLVFGNMTLDEILSAFPVAYPNYELDEFMKQFISGVFDEYSKAMKKLSVPEMDAETSKHIKESVCAMKEEGSSLDAVYQWFITYNPEYAFNETTKTFLEASYNACPEKKAEGAPDYDKLIKEQMAVLGAAAKAITGEVFDKCKDIDQYKKLLKACKEHIHAVMNSLLLQGYKEGKPYDEILAEAQKVILNIYPKLTPLMVKLQLDIEKKTKIRKGELPAEPGTVVAKSYGKLSQDEKNDINDTISFYVENVSKVTSPAEIVDAITNEFILEKDDALVEQVTHAWKENNENKSMWAPLISEIKDTVIFTFWKYLNSGVSKDNSITKTADEHNIVIDDDFLDAMYHEFNLWWMEATYKKTGEPIPWVSVPDSVKDAIKTGITLKAAQGKDVDTIVKEIMHEFHVGLYAVWEKWVGEETEAAKNLKAISVKEQVWGKLSPEERLELIKAAIQWVKDNPEFSQENIVTLLHGDYHLKVDSDLQTIGKILSNYGSALTGGKIDPKYYKEPWAFGSSEINWSHIPTEIAACMGYKANKIDPNVSVTGFFVPFNMANLTGIKTEKLKTLWLDCVEEYELAKANKEIGAGELPYTKGDVFFGDGEILLSKMLEDWILGYLNAVPGNSYLPKEIEDSLILVGKFKSPGMNAIGTALKHLVEQGDILWEITGGKYLSKIPKPKGLIVYHNLPGNTQNLIQTIAHDMAEQGNTKAEIRDMIREQFHLADNKDWHDMISGIVDLYGQEKETVPETDISQVPDSYKEVITTWIAGYCMGSLEDCVNQVAIKYGLIKNQDLTNWVKEVKEPLDELLPIKDYLDTASDTDKAEIEELAVYLMHANKFSINEMASAIAKQKKITNDDNLKDWLYGIHTKHDLKEMLGPKYEELDPITQGKVDEDITDHAEYGYDDIEGFAYGNFNVMPSHALTEKIRELTGHRRDDEPGEEEVVNEHDEMAKELYRDVKGVFYENPTKVMSGIEIYEILVDDPNALPADYFTEADVLAAMDKLYDDDVIFDTEGGYKLKEKAGAEKTLIDYSDLNEQGEDEVEDTIYLAAQIWTDKGQLLDKLKKEYNLKPDNPTLNDLINKQYEKVKKGAIFNFLEENYEPSVTFSLSHLTEKFKYPEFVPVIPLLARLVKDGKIKQEGTEFQFIPHISTKEPVKKKYAELTVEDFKSMRQFAMNLVKGGKNLPDVLNDLLAEYNLEYSEPIDKFVQGIPLMIAEEKKKLELTPEQAQNIDETMKSYIQMGWTPQALIEFFAGKMKEDKLKKSANKLYSLYKPEVIRGPMTFDKTSIELANHIIKLAENLLESGKSVADTTWYISNNYAIEKESVRDVVRNVAKKPLSQVEAAVKAMQLLGVGEYIGGCQIKETMNKLSPQNVSYCQGILDKNGYLNMEGHHVDHEMTTQKVTVQSQKKSDDNAWIMGMTYSTAKSGAWKDRLKGVTQILKEMGFSGHYIEPDSYVDFFLEGKNGMSMPISEQDRVRKAALFLSSIDNVNQLEPSCIPYALKYAAESAKKKNKTSKPWTVGVFPKEVQDWNTIVCSKILA